MADLRTAAETTRRDFDQRLGYISAMADLSRWAADAADAPGMDGTTLSALLAEMARLTAAMAQDVAAARQVGEFTDHIIKGLAEKRAQQDPAQPVSEPRDCDNAPLNQQERPNAAGGQPADHSTTHQRAAGASAPVATGNE